MRPSHLTPIHPNINSSNQIIELKWLEELEERLKNALTAIEVIKNELKNGSTANSSQSSNNNSIPEKTTTNSTKSSTEWSPAKNITELETRIDNIISASIMEFFGPNDFDEYLSAITTESAN